MDFRIRLSYNELLGLTIGFDRLNRLFHSCDVHGFLSAGTRRCRDGRAADLKLGAGACACLSVAIAAWLERHPSTLPTAEDGAQLDRLVQEKVVWLQGPKAGC